MSSGDKQTGRSSRPPENDGRSRPFRALLPPRRVERILKTIAVALAASFFLVVGFVLWALRTGRADDVIRSEVHTRLEAACAVYADFDRLEIGVFPPELYLTRLRLADAEGRELLAVDEAIVNLAVWPLFYGRVELPRVALLAPRATLVVHEGRVANLPACLLAPPEATPAALVRDSGPGFFLGLRQLDLERGRLRLVVPDVIETELDEIDVHLAPARLGGSRLIVSFDAGRVRRGAQRVDVDRLRLLAQLVGPLTHPRAITIESIELVTNGFTLDAHGALDLLGPVYEARGTLKGDLSRLPVLFPELPQIGGLLEIGASVSGNFERASAVGRVELQQGRIDDQRFGDRLIAEVRASPEGLVVPSLEVQIGSGRLLGQGRFDRARERIELSTEWRALPLGRLIECFGSSGAWVDGLVSGEVVLRGPLGSAVRLDGKVNLGLQNFRVYDRGYDDPSLNPENPDHRMLALSQGRITAGVTIQPDAITARGLTLSSGSSAAAIEARFALDPSKGMALTGEFAQLDLADLGSVGGIALSGRGPISLRLNGPYPSLRGEGRFTLDGTSVAELPLGRVSGAVGWTGTQIDFDDVEGRVKNTNYRGLAAVDLSRGVKLKLSGEVPEGRLEDVFHVLDIDRSEFGSPEAAIAGTFELSGAPDALTGPLRFSLADIVVLDERAERGNFVGAMDEGAIVFESLELDKKNGHLAVSGRFDPAKEILEATVETRGLTLSSLDVVRTSAPALDGPLELQLDVRGARGSYTGTVSARLGELRVGDRRFVGGSVKGKIFGRHVGVSGSLFSQTLSLDGRIELESGLPYRMRFGLIEFDAPHFVGAVIGAPNWRGRAVGELDFRGRLAELGASKGAVRLSQLTFSDGDKLSFENVDPVDIRVESGVARTRRLSLVGPTGRLVAAGRFGTADMNLTLEAELDLVLASTWFAPVQRSGGRLMVNAVVRGRRDAINLLGTGRIEQGLLEWQGLPGRVTGIAADLSFSQRTILIERYAGKLNSGNVSGSGQVALDGLSVGTLRLDARIDGVRPHFDYPKFELVGVFSGDLSLSGPPANLRLSGAIDVERGVVMPRFDVGRIVGDDAGQLAPAIYDPASEQLTFDLHIHPVEPIRLHNRQVNVELSGDVTLTGTNQRMGLLGSLAVTRGGRASFLGRDYRLVGGAIDFRERFRFFPHYDLELRARACDADIGINLVGDLDRVSFSFTSRPEMEESNVVLCLSTGAKLADLEQGGQGGRGTQALGFAGQVLWGVTGVDQQVRKVLPVDQIELSTEYSNRDHQYQPRLLVAKEILEGKVRLEYSSSLVESDDQRAAVRYRVTPDLTLQGGWASSDEIPVGDFGLDLKYRWEW